MHLQHIHYKHSLSLLPSCRASFITDAPLGGSRLQADLKKGSVCRQTSSLGFKPSHIPLKSCTFSSSRDMISVSFCLNRSDQQRQTGIKRDSEKNILSDFCQTYACFLSRVSLTSHLLGFSLQLSLVIFRLTGNPFILILLPVQNKHDVLRLANFTGLSIYKPSSTTFQNSLNHLSSKNATMHYFLTFYRLNNSKD